MSFGNLSKSIAALAIGCQIALSTQALAGGTVTQTGPGSWTYQPTADIPAPTAPSTSQSLPDDGVDLDQYVWDNSTQSWSSTTSGGLLSQSYDYFSSRRDNEGDPWWVSQVPSDSRYQRSYTHFSSGYSNGEESHVRPGYRDLLGHFVTNMITMDYAMENGWYQDSVSKVLDPNTGQLLNRYIDPKIMEKYFRAGTPYVNQNWGLAYLRLPAKKCDANGNCTYAGGGADYDLTFSKINNTAPIIFAKYDPVTKSGVINIQRVQTVNNGDLLIIQKRFTPRDGGPSSCMKDDSQPYVGCRWAGWTDKTSERTDYYGFANTFGYNPLMDFYDPNHPDQFTSIKPDAFYAIVAALVINQGAGLGYVANMMTRTETIKDESSGLFRKSVTYTVNAYTHPFWTTITAPTLPVPNAYHTGFKTTRGDTFKLGYAAFVRHQGQYSTLPSWESLTYSYSETHSGWTFLSMIFLAFAVGFIFPYAAAAMGFGNVGVGSLVMTGGLNLSTNALLTGLAAGLTNAAWNISQGYHSPTSAVDRMFGTGRDPLDIDSLGSGFDWRKGVQARVIGSDPGQNILGSVGATGSWFQSQSLEHKEKFASGFDLGPGDQVEFSHQAIQQMIADFESWMANF